MTAGQTFTFPTGQAMSARDVALNIYLAFLKDFPKETLSRMWNFIEPDLSANRQAKFKVEFLEKLKLYSEADTLRVLIATSRKDPRYDPLFKEFENIIFPHHATNDFAEKLATIKAAMSDLDVKDLKYFTWARQWFVTIDHNETNPATLRVLIQMFALNREAIVKLLGDIRPN